MVRARIDAVRLGLAIGIVWGIGLFAAAFLAWTVGYAEAFIEAARSVYLGYAPTLAGAFMGLLWGFIDGFIVGVLVAWLYNRFTVPRTTGG
ncbi:MAG: bacteriophage holin [Euryarchaeota archaeon]|nr:bacteriophage holin [Euryarchaeota archaeon]